MFKIGEFSKLSRIPIKTLRYYHQIGLLEPEQIDDFTGYRFYTAVQLIRLNRILALKDLGFKLEQIAQVLDDDLSAEQVRGMLRLREAEIEREIAAEQARLTRIQTRLQQFTQEAAMPTYDVVLKTVEPIHVASIRDVIGKYDQMGQLLGELFDVLAQNRVRPMGPPMAIYFDEGYQEVNVDIETAVPVANAQLQENGRVKLHHLPAFEVASVLYQGPYTHMSPAYQAIMEWISDNNYQIIGPNRDIYLRAPGLNVKPEEYVTEIQFPVAKR
ncbi:MAG: MerR family transcriptional regulator [Chloroflexi bacterium]|nr:MAG: MerR family transcriptional regulator [Chloroflexota bacterium]